MRLVFCVSVVLVEGTRFVEFAHRNALIAGIASSCHSKRRFKPRSLLSES